MLYQAGEPQEPIFIVEGEKDADNLSKLGYYCVSSENGAGSNNKGKKWYSEYNETIKGKNCIILQDNDEIGYKFADLVAAEIVKNASSVKVLDLRKIYPALENKGDISDIIEKLGPEKTKSMLNNLVESSEEWVPFTVNETDIFSSFNFYSVPDLSADERKPPDFIVEGMIPVGMTFLSGAPKIRKSFLALQLAIAVAKGSTFFGHVVNRCDVVYFDLEGSKSRISYRTDRMTEAIPKNVYISNDVPAKLADGLVDQLKALHIQRPSIRLIIIDTYSRARGSYKSCGGNAYDDDVLRLEPIQRMAIEENIAIMFVHHDKKGAGLVSDSFERLSGTMGISGSADCVMNLIADGRRFDGKATLEYTPRDAKGGELQLVFDDRCLEWQSYVEPVCDLSGNPVCSWIIENTIESALPQHEGIFLSYESIYSGAYHIFSSSPGDEVRKQIEKYREQLFKQYNLGIQLGVKSNSRRGIRVINLL